MKKSNTYQPRPLTISGQHYHHFRQAAGSLPYLRESGVGPFPTAPSAKEARLFLKWLDMEKELMYPMDEVR